VRHDGHVLAGGSHVSVAAETAEDAVVVMVVMGLVVVVVCDAEHWRNGYIGWTEGAAWV